MNVNNETLGQSVEKILCDLNNINSSRLSHRSNPYYEKLLIPVMEKVLLELPKFVRHSGLDSGQRGGQSKSSYDFLLENNKTLSVKSNKSYTKAKVCPSEVGQSSWKVLNIHFKEILNINNINELNTENFKKIVLNSIDLIIPIYLKHLISCDFLLWVYIKNSSFHYKIINKTNCLNIKWAKENFSFTKNINTWNESCTVKYRNISIGEFQLHRNRLPNKKFRFIFKNLLSLLCN